MLRSEEVRRPLQRPVQLPLTSEVQHGNRIDCSFGTVFARWRGLGIFSLARLGGSQDERGTMLLDPICGIYEGVRLWRQTCEPSFRFPELSQSCRLSADGWRKILRLPGSREQRGLTSSESEQF